MSFFFISIQKKFSFNYKYKLELNKKISWKVGTGSEYWWQVKGCCKNIYESNEEVCPPIKIKQDCQSKSQHIQVLLSPNIQSLCQELKKSKWDWTICSIEKWSRPAENEFVSEDECNILESVDYKSIIECLELSIDHKILEKIKFKETVFLSKCNSSNCTGNIISYSGSGVVRLGGQASYPNQLNKISIQNLISQKVEEKISFKITTNIKELIFSDKYTNEYIPSLNLIQTCDGCFSLPNILYVDNNLINLNSISSFLAENKYEIKDEIPIKFNKTNNAWGTVLHYISKFNDEKWKIIIDFGCFNEEDSNFYYWKFSLLFFYEKNKIRKETRLNLSIPNKFICSYSKDYLIDFKYNTQNKYIFINYVAYYDNFYFADNIGLFKSNHWTKNPEINIKITKDKIKSRINKKTIYY